MPSASAAPRRRIEVNSPRVLIVDDNEPFTEGLAQLLNGRCQVVGSIADGTLVVEAVSRLQPDVIILDVSMPGLGGLEALAEVKAMGLACSAIILTVYRDARLAAEAIKAGAAGFVLKDSSEEELFAALRTVLEGGTYLPPRLAPEVLALLAGPAEVARVALTSREREVLRLIVRGYRVVEVASALNLSPDAVEAIKHQMMQQLRVQSTAALVQYAIQHDLAVV
jgi:DNA-binding NarL/FixJ family response regulator